MSNIDVIALSMANSYTDDSMDGAGAVKGAPCQIQSITPIDGGNRITFLWVGNSGTEYTGTLDVKDGKDGKQGEDGEQGQDGRGIAHSYVNSEGHMIIVYDDGEEEDLGEITVVESSGSIQEPISVSVNVGGYKSGNVIPSGTSFDKVFRDMLNPVAYPSLTNPSATLSATGAKLLEAGSTLTTTFTLTLNRGSISPAYGTSGYRSGLATSYTFDGDTGSTNTFTRSISSEKTSYQGTIAYSAGEQPKDSAGRAYNTPLPAGTVNSNIVTYEFVNAIYANTADITTVAKLALVSKTAKQKEFSFPSQTVANPEEFHVPAEWNVTAIQVKNTLNNQWEDCASEFTQTITAHPDASGELVNYKKYTDNRGYNAGARQIRVLWN